MDDQTRLLEEQKALEIDEMFASPLALNQQNEAVNTSTANWFAQWSTLVRARILSIYFISSIIAYISSRFHKKKLFFFFFFFLFVTNEYNNYFF